MKGFRTIIGFAVIILASSGCWEKFPPIEEEERPTMSFSPLSGEQNADVKSLINSQTELQANGVLGLFGTLSYTSSDQEIFNNDYLHYANNAWTYDYLLYWVKGGFYNFAALYPYTAKNVPGIGSGAATYSFTNSGTTLSLPVETNWQSPDLMYGFATRDLTTVEDYSTVPINLKHAFAAVEFKVVNASGVTVTDLSDVALKNIIMSGTMSCSTNSALSWTLGARSDGSNYTRSGVVFQSLAYNNTEHSLFNGPFVVIPQEVVRTSASISFSKTGGDENNSVELSLGNVADVQRWEAGKKYTYIINLQSTAITFTVSVVDWNEYTYNLN